MLDDTAKPISQLERWRELAAKASKEKNPTKLMKAIDELCKELEQRGAALRKPPTPAEP